ncbi:MAG: HAMP domain-containing protein [Planctomycetes bacterium]|nr:HAMP domain-containing protein [Planctomycetota bacterium]
MKMPRVFDLVRGSIRGKIIVMIGLSMLTTVGFIVAVAVSSARDTAVNLATDQAMSVVREQGARVEGQFAAVLESLDSLASTLGAVKDSSIGLDLSRDSATGVLRMALAGNEDFLSVFSAWEPDAFDDMDMGYQGTAGSDASGRFLPMITRDASGDLKLGSVTDYANDKTPAKSHFYLATKETRAPYIGELKLVESKSGQHLVCRVTVPIVVAETFYGIVGADLDLSSLQGFVDEVDIYGGEGHVSIVTDTGTVAARDGHEGQLGHQITEVEPDQAKHLIDLSAKGTAVRVGDEFVCAVPFSTGSAGHDWLAMVEIPFDLITAEGTSLAWKLVLISVVLATLAMIPIYLVARSIATPVKHAAAILQDLASGDADMARRLEVNSRDEVAELAHWFNRFADKLQTIIAAQEAQAEEIGCSSR